MKVKEGGITSARVFLICTAAALMCWPRNGALLLPSELATWALERPPVTTLELLAPGIGATAGQFYSPRATRLGERFPVRQATLFCAGVSAAAIGAGALTGGLLGLILVTFIASLFGVASFDLATTAVMRAVVQSAHERHGTEQPGIQEARVKAARQRANGVYIVAMGFSLFAPAPLAHLVLSATDARTYLLLLAAVLAVAWAIVRRTCPRPVRGVERSSRTFSAAELWLALLISFCSLWQLTGWDGYVRPAGDDLGIGRGAVAWTQVSFLVGGVATLVLLLARRRGGKHWLGPDGLLVAGAVTTAASFAASFVLLLPAGSDTERAVALGIGRTLVETGTSITTATCVQVFATSVVAQAAITRARAAAQAAAFAANFAIWSSVEPVQRLIPVAAISEAFGVLQIAAVVGWILVRRGQRRRLETARAAATVPNLGRIVVAPKIWADPRSKINRRGQVAGTVAVRALPLTLDEWKQTEDFRLIDRSQRPLDAIERAVRAHLEQHGDVTRIGTVRAWRRRNGGYSVFARVAFGGVAVPALAQNEADRIRAECGLDHVYLAPVEAAPDEPVSVVDRRVGVREVRDKRVMAVVSRPDGSVFIVYETRDDKPGQFARSLRKAWKLQDSAALAGWRVDVLTTVAQVMSTGAGSGTARHQRPDDPDALSAEISQFVGQPRLGGNPLPAAVTIFAADEGMFAHVAIQPRRLEVADQLAQNTATRVAQRYTELAGVLVGAAV